MIESFDKRGDLVESDNKFRGVKKPRVELRRLTRLRVWEKRRRVFDKRLKVWSYRVWTKEQELGQRKNLEERMRVWTNRPKVWRDREQDLGRRDREIYRFTHQHQNH